MPGAESSSSKHRIDLCVFLFSLALFIFRHNIFLRKWNNDGTRSRPFMHGRLASRALLFPEIPTRLRSPPSGHCGTGTSRRACLCHSVYGEGRTRKGLVALAAAGTTLRGTKPNLAFFHISIFSFICTFWPQYMPTSLGGGQPL